MKRSIWLALFVLFFYLISYTGIPHSIDELATMSAAESLLHGSIQLNRMEWEQERYPPQNAPGEDGNLYSKKGLGGALVALPFLFIGKHWGVVGAVQFTFLSSALLTALTIFVFYHLAVTLKASENAALLAAIALGLGTMLWPYAKMLFSEPIAALGLSLALLGVARFSSDNRSVWLLVCSFGLGIMTLARSANAILALPFALYVTYQLFVHWRQTGRRRTFLWPGFLFALPFGLTILSIVFSNYVRFGTYLSFPQVPGEAFTTPLHVGLAGMLWSPGKGLLFYVPLAWLIGLSYAVHFRKMRQPIYLIALSVVLLTLFFYGRWYDWSGGKAWGPRFLVPVMPALVMLCLPAFTWLADGRWRRRALAVIMAITVIAQLPGVLVNFEYQENLDAVPFQDLVWQWPHSPLVTFWHNIFSSAADPIWFHPFFWSNAPWLLGLIGVTGVVLLFLHGRYLLLFWRHTDHTPGYSLPLLAILTTLWAFSLVAAAYPDVRWWEKTDTFSTNQAVRTWIGEQAADNDIVLLDLREGYDRPGRIWEWINYAPLQPDYIGWLRKPRLKAVDEARLQSWLASYGRISLLLQATETAVPDSTTENWLRQWAYEGQTRWIETQRITEFYPPNPAGSLVAAGSAVWLAAATAIQCDYRIQEGQSPNHLLIDLSWAQPMPDEVSFSVQVLDAQLQLQQQVDRVPVAGSRVGLYLAAPAAQIILKLYNPTTGQVYPVQLENGQSSEYMTLVAIP